MAAHSRLGRAIATARREVNDPTNREIAADAAKRLGVVVTFLVMGGLGYLLLRLLWLT